MSHAHKRQTLVFYRGYTYDRGMPAYDHTQVGYLTLCVSLLLALVLAWSSRLFWVHQVVPFPFMVALCSGLLLVALCSVLRVTVEQEHVRIILGYGVFRKRFRLIDVVEMRQVQCPWRSRWGSFVRLGLCARIFMVSGADAVELVMQNKKRYHIGTDEPSALMSALEQARRAQR